MEHTFEGAIRKNMSYQVTSRIEVAQPDRTKIAKPIIKIKKRVKKSDGFMPLPEPANLKAFKSTPIAKPGSLDDLLPENIEKKKKPSQVFQGKFMREDASLLSKMFYTYPEPLVRIAQTEQICVEQYGNLPDRLRIEHECEKLESHIDHFIQKDPSDKKAIFKAILSRHKISFILATVGRLFQAITELYMVYLVKEVVGFVELSDFTEEQWKSAAWAGFLLVLIRVINVTSWENMCWYMVETGHFSHTSLKTLLFKKNFKLSPATNKDYSTGEILSLIESDANRIWTFVWDLPQLVNIPFIFLTAGYTIWTQVGANSLSASVLFSLTIVLQKIQTSRNQRLHKQVTKFKDERMMKTSEAFNHAKNLKLYSWEQRFGDKISDLYDQEMQAKKDMMSFNGLNQCVQELINNFLPLCVFSVYVYRGNAMSMSQIVLVTMMLEKVKDASRSSSHVYEMFNELLNSMANIQKYFVNPEVQASIINSTKDEKEQTSLRVKGSFSWGFEKTEEEGKESKDNKEKPKDEAEKTEEKKDQVEGKKEQGGTLNNMLTLKDIDLDIKKGEFVIIVGKVGSGKTSLLNAIFGEMVYVPGQEISMAGGLEKQLSKNELEGLKASLFDLKLKKGEEPIRINGNVSYVEQQPWTQNLTLRENILFGKKYNKRQYVETLVACQLESDLSIMPAGDFTEIGEKGINLSGGQKARVSLARAVYQEADVVLMDDPISALDANVRKAIFKEVFQKILKDKTRILVTHAVDFVHLADKIVIMDNGRIQAQGTYEELSQNEYMIQILDIHKKHKEENQAVAGGEKPAKQKSIDDLLDGFEDELDMEKTEKSEQAKTDAETEAKNEVPEQKQLTDEELEEKLQQFKGKKDEKEQKLLEEGKLLDDDSKEVVHVGVETYKRMLDMSGGWTILGVVIFVQCASEYFNFQGRAIRNDWASEDDKAQQSLFAPYMKAIILMASFQVIALTVKVIILTTINYKLSNGFHTVIMTKVMNAPINTFFDVTPVGKILVRFSKDLEVFKGPLFWSCYHFSEQITAITSTIAVLLLVSPYNVLSIIAVVYLFSLFAIPFLAIDNQLHKQASNVWTPIHSYWQEVLRGGSVIRAFGAMDQFLKREMDMMK